MSSFQFGALDETRHDPSYYRTLTVKTERIGAGDFDLRKGHYHSYTRIQTVLQNIRDNGRVPKNILEETWIDVHDNSDWGSYDILHQKVDFKDTAEYLYTLDTEPDPVKFLQLLMLHESAGIFLGERNNLRPISVLTDGKYVYNGFTVPDFDSMKTGFNASGVTQIPKPLINKNCDSVTMEPYQYDLFCRMSIRPVQYYSNTARGFINTNEPYEPNSVDAFFVRVIGDAWEVESQNKLVAQIEGLRYCTYQGWRYKKAFIDIVLRFRERCMAYILKETFFMLDIAKLEDLDTAITAYQYLIDTCNSIRGIINDTERIQIRNESGASTWHDCRLRNAFMSFLIPGATGRYATEAVSIRTALELQFDSVAWFIESNKSKLEGRIAQLSDPNMASTIKAMKVQPFQTDPLQNPFLVFEPVKEQYINVASNAGKTVAVPVIQARPTDFIPVESMLKAPEVFLKYHRVATPEGITYSNNDLNPGSKSAATLWLAAAAAAGIFFLNR